MNSRKGQRATEHSQKAQQHQIPLSESSTHILELSQKPPYNPTQHAKRRSERQTKPTLRSAKSNSKKTGDNANHA
jgi:hypothetical protein